MRVLSLLLLAACAQPAEVCDCPIQLASVTLHVLDASTHAEIASPSFSENGAALAASCTDSACSGWRIELVGDHMVTIAAAGYTSQAVAVSLVQPQGCCSMGTQLDQTVMLAPW